MAKQQRACLNLLERPVQSIYVRTRTYLPSFTFPFLRTAPAPPPPPLLHPTHPLHRAPVPGPAPSGWPLSGDNIRALWVHLSHLQFFRETEMATQLLVHARRIALGGTSGLTGYAAYKSQTDPVHLFWVSGSMQLSICARTFSLQFANAFCFSCTAGSRSHHPLLNQPHPRQQCQWRGKQR